MNKSQDPFKDLNKELVAEQPGLGVSLAGLALVLLFGFGLRFLCQSDRYLELVENATRQIDPRVQAHVGTVELSLADGMLPELAVVIKNIEAESSETCWMRPSLEVDEVKLPLDFFKLLQGQSRPAKSQFHSGPICPSARKNQKRLNLNPLVLIKSLVPLLRL